MTDDDIDSIIDKLSNIQVSKSTRGGDLLVFDNFEFKVDYRSKTSDKISWRCNEFAGCTARVYTYGLKPPVHLNPDRQEHCHAAKPAKIEVRAKVNEMKESRASDSGAAPRQIIQQNQVQISQEAIVKFPSYEALRQRLLRSKTDQYSHLAIPTCLAEIDLKDEFRVSCNGELFLQYDSVKEDLERMIIFFTKEGAELMINSHWYIT